MDPSAPGYGKPERALCPRAHPAQPHAFKQAYTGSPSNAPRLKHHVQHSDLIDTDDPDFWMRLLQHGQDRYGILNSGRLLASYEYDKMSACGLTARPE
jgi:hypothetical protein